MTEAHAAVTASPDDRLDFKKVFPIVLIVFVDLMGLTIIIPLLPLYATSFGADPLIIGILGASYPLMQFLGGPLLGGLSDRFGRKPVLVVSQIGTFIGFIILGFAGSLSMLFLSRIIDGLSGANIAAAQAALTDSTSDRTRAQGLGLIGAAFGMGFILGPLVAFVSLALSQNNYHIPAFIAAGFSALSIVLTLTRFKETLPPEKRSRAGIARAANIPANILRALTSPVVGTLLVLLFLQQVMFGEFQQLFALFTLSRLGLDASGNAFIFAFIGIIIVIMQGKYIGPLTRRFGERRVIYLAMALLGAGMILTSITPEQPVTWYSRARVISEMTAQHENPASAVITVSLPDDSDRGWLGLGWLLAALIPATIGGGLLQPSLNSLITRRVAATQVGETLGVSAALLSAANALAPLLGGVLFKALGATAPFLVGGVVMLALLVFALQKITPEAGAAMTFAAVE